MQAFLSGARDAEGKAITKALDSALLAHGVKTTCAGDHADTNPISLHERITADIRDNPVIYVLTQESLKDFGDGTSEPLVTSKITMHSDRSSCPVIPVAPPGLSADLVPNVLKALGIERFDPLTGEGADRIAERLRRFPVVEKPVTTPIALVATDPGSSHAVAVRTLRDVTWNLETVSPSKDALPLVREWQYLVEHHGEGSADFVHAFPAVERVIKSVGDVRLMKEIADLCLTKLDGARCLGAEERMRARILICGQAWALRRQHDLAGALRAATAGLELARGWDDRTTVALGHRCLARIHRAMASEVEGYTRERCLADAEQHATKARSVFAAVQADEEVGVSDMVLAHIFFTRYRLTGRIRALLSARGLALAATRRIWPDREREYYELFILRAEIAMALWQRRQARKFISKAIRDLGPRAVNGASYAELLGRAHLVRALLNYRTPGQDATADIAEARKHFVALGLDCLVAGCDWLTYKLEPKSRGLTRRCVKTLERRLPDSRDRLRAIDERKQLVDQDTTRGAIDWEPIVRQLTREAERRVTAARQEDGYAGSAAASRRRKPLSPTVFVSYVHFSDEHKTQVRKFATFLESVGVDVQLDSWSDTHRRKSWDDWILEKITTTDYVLPIASPAYREVFEGRSPAGKRLGTQAEAVVIRELLYSDRQKWMPKILPVLLPGGEVGDIPLIMQPNGADHYVVEDFTVDGAEKLLRVLFDSPRYPRPPRGKPPYLPPKS